MRPASVGFQCPDEGATTNVRGVRTSPGLLVLVRSAPVTALLIVANLAVFAVFVANGSQFLGSGIGPAETDAVQQSVVVANGDFYRIFTAMFSHFGLIHVGSNMLVLFFVGVPLERQLRSLRFAAIYLVSGVGGGIVTYLFASPLEISAGASGAIFGVAGAYFVVARRLPSAQLGSVGGLILVNLFITFAIPGISITDHLGGLAVGALLGGVVGLESRMPARQGARRRAVWLEVAAFVLVSAVLVGIGSARTHDLREHPPRFAFTQTSAIAPAQPAPPPV
jgi:membrane associated rhomboid family serine protease